MDLEEYFMKVASGSRKHGLLPHLSDQQYELMLTSLKLHVPHLNMGMLHNFLEALTGKSEARLAPVAAAMGTSVQGVRSCILKVTSRVRFAIKKGYSLEEIHQDLRTTFSATTTTQDMAILLLAVMIEPALTKK